MKKNSKKVKTETKMMTTSNMEMTVKKPKMITMTKDDHDYDNKCDDDHVKKKRR